jgi:hypothetical protein
MSLHRTCGDVARYELLVICECGCLRGAEKPHGYHKPAQFITRHDTDALLKVQAPPLHKQ